MVKVSRCTTICTSGRRRFREIFVATAAARSSFVRGNLKDDGLIHRDLFVGNYVKATLPSAKSTAAR